MAQQQPTKKNEKMHQWKTKHKMKLILIRVNSWYSSKNRINASITVGILISWQKKNKEKYNII